MLAKYLKNREAFTAKIRTIGLDSPEVSEWEDALNAAQHHADLAPSRERETLTYPHPGSAHAQSPGGQNGAPGPADGAGGALGGGGAAAGEAAAAAAAAAQAAEEGGRPLYNNGVAGVGIGINVGAMVPRKKPGRKPGKMKDKLFHTPEAKRARALDSMVSAAERSNLLQEGAAAAGAEHMRRLELADAEVWSW